jgi:hypothetical protein
VCQARRAAADYRKVMQSAGLQASMSRKAHCYDNAPKESFFHTLKTELIHHRQYATRAEATRDIFAYIEGFYQLFTARSVAPVDHSFHSRVRLTEIAMKGICNDLRKSVASVSKAWKMVHNLSALRKTNIYWPP